MKVDVSPIHSFSEPFDGPLCEFGIRRRLIQRMNNCSSSRPPFVECLLQFDCLPAVFFRRVTLFDGRNLWSRCVRSMNCPREMQSQCPMASSRFEYLQIIVSTIVFCSWNAGMKIEKRSDKSGILRVNLKLAQPISCTN